jgi:hypothetical protein
MKKRAFISFDYDNDEDLRTLLVGQSRHPNSPFEIKDRSIKEHLPGDWKNKVFCRMNNVDVVIVICGEKTHLAQGVTEELKIEREKRKPYFLLQGRLNKTCTKPISASQADKMYKWSWDNLDQLIKGYR